MLTTNIQKSQIQSAHLSHADIIESNQDDVDDIEMQKSTLGQANVKQEIYGLSVPIG